MFESQPDTLTSWQSLLTRQKITVSVLKRGSINGAPLTTHSDCGYLFASLYRHCLCLLRTKISGDEVRVRSNRQFCNGPRTLQQAQAGSLQVRSLPDAFTSGILTCGGDQPSRFDDLTIRAL